MCRRITLIILFLFFTVAGVSAETFTVTSNADSGPGTLREALTKAAANGTTETDHINFNLGDHSENGRTITTFSKMPDISSNVVIDGSTQPGPKFGVSDAKIKIHFAPPAYGDFYLFNSTGASAIEIYGLWILYDSAYGNGSINCLDFDKITIGAPGKGNLFDQGNINIKKGKSVIFQNNLCGTDETGETATSFNIGIFSCDDVIMGGSGATKNVVAGSTTIYFDNPAGSTLDMSYNIMGTNYTGTAAPYGFNLIDQTRVTIQGPYGDNGFPLDVPLNATIKNNIIADIYGYDLLDISALGGKLVIQGNAFNTDYLGEKNFNEFSQSIAEYAIGLNFGGEVLVGGEDPSERNLIAYTQEGIGYDPYGKYQFSRNSIFCVGEISFAGYVDNDLLPQVKIKNFTNTSISGTGTPAATIELYKADCSCSIPAPKSYFATVTADANGNWSYAGSADGYVMASATKDKLTGLFTGLNIDDAAIQIVDATCGGNGSITGIKSPFSTGYRWYDSAGKLISSTADLKNVLPGDYTLKIGNGGACDLTKTYTIADNSLKIDVSQLKVTDFGCNKPGSITGIQMLSSREQFTPQWFVLPGNSDANEKKLCDCTEIQNLEPGFYEFKVLSKDGLCENDYGVYEVKNTAGVNIDVSKMKIQSALCGQSTGSITNIIVKGGSGDLKYTWWNSQQQQVSATKDLTGQPGGIYKLQVTDDTQCGPVYSTDITIPETNGINLDESKATKTIAICGQSNGTVTGITASGATKYQWTNASGSTVSATADLTGAPSGDYTLTVSNNFGCSKVSQVYHIDQQSITQFPQYTATTVSSCFNASSGSVSVATDALVKSLRWVSGTGSTIGTAADVQNLAPGNYMLYLTDQNGCEQLYRTYTIGEEPEYTVANYGELADDQCGLKTGSVSGVTISGGVPPYTYKWTDAAGNNIGTNNSISGLAAGDYKLNVVDTRCGNVDIIYTIKSTSAGVAPPSVTDVQLCSSGGALLTVNNASASTIYRLYETNSSTNPIDEKSGGRFNVNVTTNRSYFISQLNGTCESSRAEVKVSVGLSAVDIANTFTPNGDGINDYWQIKSIESYPSAIVQVFTRYGDKVYESKGYTQPFDGTKNGKQLPTGVYYYIINLNTNCNVLSGSLTIVR